jgi:hypothetical protein
LLRNGQPAPGTAPGGLRVSSPGEKDLRWSGPVPPGDYQASVYETYRQNLWLGPGDRMLLNLRRSEGGVAFERGLFALEENNRYRPAQVRDSWRTAVLRNGYLVSDSSLRMLLTVEDERRRLLRPEEALRQIRPGFLWMEIRPRGLPGRSPSLGGSPISGVTWFNDEHYPAPAWGLRVADWPAEKWNRPLAPELEVWWNDNPVPPTDAVLELNPMQTNQQVRVNGQIVEVEAAFEPTRLIAVGPDRKAERSSLVVRIRHDPGQPVWAGLAGHGGGEEHYYFFSAGQYTAVFWGVTEEQARGFTLHLTSLGTFKQNARHRLFFEDLPAPRPGELGPDPAPPTPG